MTLVKFQPATYKSFFPEFRNIGTSPATLSRPAVNILETAEGFEIDLAVPGLNREDFEVKVEQNILTVTGQKAALKASDNVQVHRQEFNFESFERNFRLPEAIDTASVNATYTNGILQIRLQFKAESKPVTRTVAVA